MKISGNTVLITGGSSGIGLAMAKTLVEYGNKVIITGRNTERLQMLKKSLPYLEVYAGDLTNTSTIYSLYDYVQSHFPELNMLINNAAVQYNYLFTDNSEHSHKIAYEIACNFTAPVVLTDLLLPILQRNNSGALVNISSALAFSPKKSASVYCATKAAIHSYSKTLRYQLEKTSLKVFEIIPPLVDTPMTEGRGKNKIDPQLLVDEFIRNLKNDHYESYIGKTKLLRFLHRLLPALTNAMMKNGQ